MRRQIFAALLLAAIGWAGSISSSPAGSPLGLASSGQRGEVSTAADSTAPAQAPVLLVPDYPSALWTPAAPTNYTVSNRPAGYQVNMIVIHDIEGSYNSAITAFRNPARHGSAHYVISRKGRIAQMVAEKDIAWHAGNWDYNTRAIGIEHEGYAGVVGSFTIAEYKASAHLAASICSRWGVPMDRKHVIGHYQVPDPFNPALGGGAEHHWDPGKYWNWPYYMSLAASYARTLPSPPHMGPNPTASSAEAGVVLSWQPAQTCTLPIASYSIVGQPGNITLTVPGNIHSVWIPGLTDGVAYSFTVTATNAQGSSSLTSNTAVPGPPCTAAALTGGLSSPQPTGTSIRFTATSTGCNTPEYAFWVAPGGGKWTLARDYGSAAWTWITTGLTPGTYQLGVWARQRGASRPKEAYGFTTFTLDVSGCQDASLTPSVPSPQVAGTPVTFLAASTGCTSPEYQFWLVPPGGNWTIVQPYSTGSTWLFDSSKYGPGDFQVGVWSHQVGSGGKHDSFFVTTYWIHAATGCVVSALTPSAAPPQVLGSSVTFTPQQTGCTQQYKFWLMRPGGSFKVVQPYGVGSTWLWSTAGYLPGVYEVGVWEGSSTTPNLHESYAITSFTLQLGTCRSADLTASVAPPQSPGAAITLSATSVGCASPQYEFWVMPPGGGWSIARGYGAATWDWATAGLAPGTYQVGVWAIQPGSTATHDTFFIGTYQLTQPACTSPTIVANPASPQATGTSVTFTATSAGCASALYEFWGRPPGASWKLMLAYGSSAAFTWNSSGATAGNYTFAVWAKTPSSSGLYDSYAVSAYAISG